MLSGYTPTKISTLVDRNGIRYRRVGYTPTKISTLVDNSTFTTRPVGYTPTKISTLVDDDLQGVFGEAIRLRKFLLL